MGISRLFAIMGLVCCLGVLLCSLLAGVLPPREGPELRRRASGVVAAPGAADLPPPIENSGPERGGYSLRRRAAPPRSLPPDPPVGGVSRNASAPFPEETFSLAVGGDTRVPVLLRDGTPSPPLVSDFSPYHGEDVDATGRPLRWLAIRPPSRLEPVCRGDHPAIRLGSLALRNRRSFAPPLLGPFNVAATFARARRYKLLVERAASRFGLSPALLYAIIHNESNFSSAEISSRCATGLMQVRPGTGGDVHVYLHGRAGYGPAADLGDPEMNIRYGAAYLHMLLHRYLADVRDPRSREYCAIAGYNMGPNRLLRFFADDRAQAVRRINAMTPEALFRRLVTGLPLAETRFFVAKVERSRAAFARFQ